MAVAAALLVVESRIRGSRDNDSSSKQEQGSGNSNSNKRKHGEEVADSHASITFLHVDKEMSWK